VTPRVLRPAQGSAQVEEGQGRGKRGAQEHVRQYNRMKRAHSRPCSLVLAGLLSIAASIALTLRLRGGVRLSPTVLAPHPWRVPFAEFNSNEGSVGPRHNHAALEYMGTKAGAGQEWLQYSLHHEGTLQQARNLYRRLGRPALSSKLDAVTPEENAVDADPQGDKDNVRAGLESSGSFLSDDASLFGKETFSSADANVSAQAPAGALVPPESTGDKAAGHGSEESQEPDEPSDFLKGMVKAVFTGPLACQIVCIRTFCPLSPTTSHVWAGTRTRQKFNADLNPFSCPPFFLPLSHPQIRVHTAEAMPPDASLVLAKSNKGVRAAKEELRTAADLKAEAQVEDKRANGLAVREAQLEQYELAKQKVADAAKSIAERAKAEYKAEQDEVEHMQVATDASKAAAAAATAAAATNGGVKEAGLRQRLHQHIPLLRVVDKLARRVDGGRRGHAKSAPAWLRRGRGVHPRSRHQLPPKAYVH
jgi:hypothetical protein